MHCIVKSIVYNYILFFIKNQQFFQNIYKIFVKLLILHKNQGLANMLSLDKAMLLSKTQKFRQALLLPNFIINLHNFFFCGGAWVGGGCAVTQCRICHNAYFRFIFAFAYSADFGNGKRNVHFGTHKANIT